jgi:acyl dehydratase
VAEALWLEDLKVGHRFRTDEYHLTADAIIDFARQWDPQPFHLSDETARDTFFQGLAASGWQVASIGMRLLVTSGLRLAGGLIGAGGEVKWPTATRPGDRLHVEAEVTEVTPSRSDTTRGRITIVYETVNQYGEVRQRSTAKLLAFSRTRKS